MDGERAADQTIDLLGGLVLDDGIRLDRVGLRRLSGREEEWLARHRNAPQAVAVTELLAACIEQDALTPRECARRLLVGDRDYLMVWLRRLTLGDQVAAVYHCPACDSKMDVLLDLAETPAESAPQTTAAFELTLGDGRITRFRLPNGSDQEAVASEPVERAVEILLRRCLLDHGGQPLAEEDQRRIIDEMERRAPRIEIDLDLTCPECDHAFTAPFDPVAFFIAEMASAHGTLLREVHQLAFSYGWSEAAILALDRDRRRAYLSLVADERSSA
jgi:hypothetical protein